MDGRTVPEAVWVERARTLAFWVLALLVAMSIGLVLGAKHAHADTFTVNSTADGSDGDPGDGSCHIAAQSGACTLRAAIEESNAFPGADTIKFAIPGAGPHTISPFFELPKIRKRVTINGYSESLGEANRAKPNTASTGTDAVLKIEIDGAPSQINPQGLENGLYLQGPDASNSVIRGLVINDFWRVGIVLAGGTGYRVEGNFIGTDPSGTSGSGTSASPGLEGPGVSVFGASNSTIGGTSPAARNLISGNGTAGVFIPSMSSGNKVQGNLIGTKANGTEALTTLANSQRDGVSVGGSSNTIGGVDANLTDTNSPANTIAFNKEAGVLVIDSIGNRILSNSIFENGDLGINLIAREPWTDDANGVNMNDPKDPDESSNRLQNYPVITAAQYFGGLTSISGTLNSTPSTNERKSIFIIQFFSSPTPDSSGYGEGKTYLGQIVKETDRRGNTGPFTFTVDKNLSTPTQYITATATNKRTGDTSEFSAAKPVQGIVIGP